MVATTSAFGTGISLTSALWIALVEPDFRIAVMKQAWYRIFRQGNKNPIVYAFLITVTNCDVEAKIMRKNEVREMLGIAAKGTEREEPAVQV
jgi:SNF2 family DNA or RNA helicase